MHKHIYESQQKFRILHRTKLNCREGEWMTNSKMVTRLSIAVVLMVYLLATVAVFAPVRARAESAEEVTSGLLGWWQMNHSSGYNATDSSENGLNGIVQSARADNQIWVGDDTPTCDDNNTQALSLNGPSEESGEFVSFDAPNPTPDSLTISAWVKINETEPLSEEYMPIAGNLIHSEGDFGFGLEVRYAENKIYFINNRNFDGNFAENSPVYDYNESEVVDKWLHVAGTYDYTTGVSNLYINGDLVDSYDGVDERSIFYDDGSFSIGRDGSLTRYFKGLIDDVRLYDRALNSYEITELASTGCSETTEEPVDDEDGITATIEDAAPNNGDANNDGTRDSEQPRVTSLVSPVNNKYVVLETGGCTTNSSVSVIKEPSVSTQDDDNYQYPFGFINFTLTGCSVGSTHTITKHYFGDYDPAKLVLRKYNPTKQTYTTISTATITAVTIGGQKAVKVVYQVTDGGELDQDGTANGTIVDPAGIGLLEVTAPATGFKKESVVMPFVLFSVAAGMFILNRVRRV
jgi:hypothetical protein